MQTAHEVGMFPTMYIRSYWLIKGINGKLELYFLYPVNNRKHPSKHLASCSTSPIETL